MKIKITYPSPLHAVTVLLVAEKNTKTMIANVSNFDFVSINCFAEIAYVNYFLLWICQGG